MLRRKIVPMLSLVSFLTAAPLLAKENGNSVCSPSFGMQPGERGLKPGRPDAYTRGIHTEPGNAVMPVAMVTPEPLLRTGRPEYYTRGILGVRDLLGESGGGSMAEAPRTFDFMGPKAKPGRPESYTRGIAPEKGAELACPVFFTPKA